MPSEIEYNTLFNLRTYALSLHQTISLIRLARLFAFDGCATDIHAASMTGIMGGANT